MNSVSIVKCADYNQDEIALKVKQAVDLLGGIDKFVKSSDRVLLKPNLLSPALPEKAITTHPEFVRAVIKLIKPTGAKIVLGDSCGGFVVRKAEDLWERTGIGKVCQEEGVELVKFETSKLIDGIPIADEVLNADVIINLPKLKTHSLTILTAAIKNMYGVCPGFSKLRFHRLNPTAEDMSRLVLRIFDLAKPALNIADGVIAMEGSGPGSDGIPRQLGVVLASADGVALDSVFSAIVNLKPERVYTNRLGNADLSKVEIKGQTIDSVKVKDFKLPYSATLTLPNPAFRIIISLLKYKPTVIPEACVGCEICAKSCPVQTITMEDKIARINYKKCITCMCCHEMCPHKAIYIKQSLLAKILGGR